MKSTFVLDESAIHCAAIGEDERVQDYPSAPSLLSDVASNCHALGFSNELWRKTLSRLNSLRDSGAFVNPVFGRWSVLVLNPEKFVFVEPQPIEVEQGIPEDDWFLVRLSSHLQAILVTTDNRLTAILAGNPVALQHHAQAAHRPEGALPYAGPQ